ncbi:peptidase family M48-domain-containing protein [Sporodiniella umbellata]|nr:peptidase family M48-domain-containing protein [Sporodiniella umbellata]
MFPPILRNSRPLIFRHTWVRPSRQINYTLSRSFHASHRSQVPILPLPAFVLALKTGQLVTYVTALSRLSLTLAAGMSKRKGKIARAVVKLAASIPLFGVASMLVVGLDEAPNTSRIRLAYLNKEEQKEMIDSTFEVLIKTYSENVAPQNSKEVQWLQKIVDRLAAVAVDDVRDPVRHYYGKNNEPQEKNGCLVVPSNDIETIARSTDVVQVSEKQQKYKVEYISGEDTVNALCIGNNFIVFEPMAHLSEFDEHKMAAILAHEMAHSLQSHFVEKHGLVAFVSTIGDISRAVLWPITFSLGPYFNDSIDRFMSWLTLENCEKGYNRQLEREADLVGLKLMAKAGYDPRRAIEVWKSIHKVEKLIESDAKAEEKADIEEEDWAMGFDDWFGGTHPPTEARIEYLTSHLSKAMHIYEKSIEINGQPSLMGERESTGQKTESDETKDRVKIKVVKEDNRVRIALEEEPKAQVVMEKQSCARLRKPVLVN